MPPNDEVTGRDGSVTLTPQSLSAAVVPCTVGFGGRDPDHLRTILSSFVPNNLTARWPSLVLTSASAFRDAKPTVARFGLEEATIGSNTPASILLSTTIRSSRFGAFVNPLKSVMPFMVSR